MRAWSDLSIVSGSLAENLSQRLIRMIEEGELAPGDRLPAERDLAEASGISRTSVREALRDLELRGMISRRPGRGTIVETTPRPTFDAGLLGRMAPSHRVLREVMDLRGVVEPPIAERAAERARDVELAALLAPLEKAEAELRTASPSIELMVRLDVEFHVAIAHLTQNPMLVRLLEVTNEWMAPSRESAHQTMSRLNHSVTAHRRIYEAIRRREPEAARDAMAEHIREIFEGIGVAPWR